MMSPRLHTPFICSNRRHYMCLHNDTAVWTRSSQPAMTMNGFVALAHGRPEPPCMHGNMAIDSEYFTVLQGWHFACKI